MKAIETEYDGRRFRSRLEARWAIFFDFLRIKWQYEPEAFVVPGGGYLPDLRIDGGRGQTFWAEIKPVAFTANERMKSESVVMQTGKPMLLLPGEPGFAAYEMLHREQYGSRAEVVPDSFIFPSTYTNGRFWFEPAEYEVKQLESCPRYTAAVFGCRAARFEPRQVA